VSGEDQSKDSPRREEKKGLTVRVQNIGLVAANTKTYGERALKSTRLNPTSSSKQEKKNKWVASMGDERRAVPDRWSRRQTATWVDSIRRSFEQNALKNALDPLPL